MDLRLHRLAVLAALALTGPVACSDGASDPLAPLPVAEGRKGPRPGGGGGGGGGGPFVEDFDVWDPARWTAGDHALGRGWLSPDNVNVAGGLLTLRLPAGTFDGGEIRSADKVRYGTYEARIRAADAPGSLSTFFLYEFSKNAIDEIDVEIRAELGEVWFTTWQRSRQTNHLRVPVAFDPAADFHVYGIDWARGTVRFTIDGVVRATFTSGIPNAAMYVMANAWWPTWSGGDPPASDRAAAYDWIRW